MGWSNLFGASASFDPAKTKGHSECLIKRADGEVCDWLPCVEPGTPRSDVEIIDRSLVLFAMLQIAFNAPTQLIKTWLEEHDLCQALSLTEKGILDSERDVLSEQTITNLHWYIEGLWMFLWIGRLHNDPNFLTPIPDTMASMCPDIQIGEGPEKFREGMSVRKRNKIAELLDLYYRCHWCARHRLLSGQQEGPFVQSMIIERRRALEWANDAGFDWDEGSLDT